MHVSLFSRCIFSVLLQPVQLLMFSLIILDKILSEFLHKTMFICKTHNSALKIRNHHFKKTCSIIQNN